MAAFSDIPQFLLIEYLSTINSLQSTPSIDISYLRDDVFVTKGGNLLELYIDDEENGYKKILFMFEQRTGDINKFYFFNKSNQLTFEDTYSEYSGEGYNFKVYDPSTEESVVIEDGQSVYVRNDSLFHEWLEESAETIFQNEWYSDFLIKNFINTNEIFIYFGNVYSDADNSYVVNYENMQEFTKRALPEHQRTDRIKEFLDLSFGNVFSEIYSKTKNLNTLMDTMSVDSDFLHYILEFTNWSFLDKSTFTIAEREFVRDIVFLLKKKGTISSLYILYKIFSNKSNNNLNVYERWHSSTLTGQISASDYYDYLYLHNYISNIDSDFLDNGAGAVYYSQFFPNFEWGISGTKITIHSNSSDWNINHKLNTYNINFQVYDVDFKRIFPHSSYLSDKDNLVLNFETDVSGYCFIKKCLYRKEIDTDYSNTVTPYDLIPISGSSIDHSFDMTAISYNYDSSNYGIHPGFIELRNDYIDTDITDGYIVMDQATEKKSSLVTSSVWNITHSIDKRGVLVDTYDGYNERIWPDSVQLIDKNNIKLTFSESVSGYVLLTEIGSPPESIDAVTAFEGTVLSPHYIVEIDLSTEPMDGTDILTEATHQNMISYWEKVRPINNVSNYQLLVSPESNFTGNYYNIYPSIESYAYIKSKMLTDASYFNSAESGTYFIGLFFSDNNTWIIQHNLNTYNLLTDFYDVNDTRLVPLSIEYINHNTLEVIFSEKTNGTALLSVADYRDKTSLGTITHNQNDDVIINFINNTNYSYVPEDVTLTSSNVLDVDGIINNTSVLVKSDTDKYNFSAKKTWYIEHNTGYKWFISAFYNSNDEQIQPKTVEILSNNVVKVEFSEAITGYAVLFMIEDGIDVYEKIVLNEYTSPYIVISDIQDDMTTYDYKALIKDAQEDENYIYLTAEIPESNKYTIREIGVIDSNDNVLFVTICSDIVKSDGIKMIIFYKINKEDL